MSSFAAPSDVISLSGRDYTAEEQERITALLPLVSDVLRQEALKVGKDLDAMVLADESYAGVVKVVTVDVVVRALRQSVTDEPLSQESQSALGYSWSGTYAIPGGGIAQSVMNNDLKRLGFKRQKYGVINLWEKSGE